MKLPPKGARLAFVCALLSCSGGPPPVAPSAVIVATPTTVCLGDAYATPIVLDARQSAPRLTLVATPPDPSEPPLRFLWSFAGSAMRVTQGDPSQATITVAMAADRPLHVSLHVENGEGGATDALLTVAVTPLDSTGACPLPPVAP